MVHSGHFVLAVVRLFLHHFFAALTAAHLLGLSSRLLVALCNSTADRDR